MSAEVGAAYDARSGEYVERFGRVEQHPLDDRVLVRRWRDTTRGRLLDAGCGPGEWSPLLQVGGRDVVGVDVSTEFLTVARRRHPTVPFLRGSLTALPLRPGTVGGVLAWYSIIHTPPEALPSVFDELSRVLDPDGSVLLGFCDGEPAQSFAHSVITAYFWSVEALSSMLAGVGFAVVEHERRQDEGQRPHAALIARRTPRG